MAERSPSIPSVVGVACTAAAVVVSTLAALAVGARRWDRATAQVVGRLRDAQPDGAPAASGEPTAFTLDQLDGLPAPVAPYFRYALTPGQPLVRQARIEHAGEFALKPGAWAPFTSVQHVRVGPPGFVWDARIRMAPGPPVRVRDGYVSGAGSVEASYAGLVPVADAGGTPEMAASALMRFLAEAAWVPTALLPAAGVVWTAIDDSTAQATLEDGETQVSLAVHFGPQGGIARVTGQRYRDVGGIGVLTPWEGHFYEDERCGGMEIPMRGEVAWLLPEGRHSYWRGRITAVEYVPRASGDGPP